MSTSDRARPTGDDVPIHGWLEQLAGSHAVTVDVRDVRRRARRVRRTRTARQAGLAAAAVAAVLALTQSVIGGAAQPAGTSSDSSAADPVIAVGAPSQLVAESPATTVPRALPAAPGTPAPRPAAAHRAGGSWGLVPLVPSGRPSAIWARDRAFDMVVPLDASSGDAPTPASPRGVTSW